MRDLFIISAPSGAGKTTLCREVLKRFKDITYSISYTTRKPRNGERDGIDYHFITKEDFKRKIENNKWAEWAEVCGNFYGTSAEFLDTCSASGKRVLLDIDVQGAMQIKKRYPDSVAIFIMPPSLETLRTRLESRDTDSRQVIERRLEIAKKEIGKKHLYRHVIINDQLSKAVSELIKIIESYC
ncbi:MAG: guanylate kinase [Thermodesulfobacteriota bacterium]|nr:guanylate kinase [Thermodesulfobacteriota bacterium]